MGSSVSGMVFVRVCEAGSDIITENQHLHVPRRFPPPLTVCLCFHTRSDIQLLDVWLQVRRLYGNNEKSEHLNGRLNFVLILVFPSTKTGFLQKQFLNMCRVDLQNIVVECSLHR